SRATRPSALRSRLRLPARGQGAAVPPRGVGLSALAGSGPKCSWRSTSVDGESRGGIAPPRAPRTVREPLDSYGSRCSAVAMTQLPMSEQIWVGTAKPVKPISRSFGFVTQPFELPARPADDIDIDPLEGRAQLRPIELTVVGDPTFDVRIVPLG